MNEKEKLVNAYVNQDEDETVIANAPGDCCDLCCIAGCEECCDSCI